MTHESHTDQAAPATRSLGRRIEAIAWACFKLFAIRVGNHLVALSIAGAILTARR